MLMKKTKTDCQKNIIYGKIYNKIEYFAQRLEENLDSEDELWENNVLTLHGHLSKEEKLCVIN